MNMKNGEVFAPTGKLTRLHSSQVEGLSISVKDYGAVGDGVVDDSDSIIAAWAAAEADRKSLHFPEGIYLITKSIGTEGTARGRWYGDGAISGSTVIRCSGFTHTVAADASGVNVVSGTPAVYPPNVLEGIRFESDTEDTGVGLQVGKDNQFTGYLHWDDVEVRNFGLGIQVYNLYMSHWNHVHVIYGGRGVQMNPSTGGDSGYITTFNWSNCLIGYNKGWGLYANFPAGCRNWQMYNCVIEANCSTSDKSHGQFIGFNAALHAYSLYMEGTSDTPAIYNVNQCKYDIVDPYFNGTGGWSLGNGSSTRVRLIGGSLVGATDRAFASDFNANQSFHIEDITLPDDHVIWTSTGGAEVTGRNVFGVQGFVSNQFTENKYGGVNGGLLAGQRRYSKDMTTTVTAGSSKMLITNEYMSGAGANTTGFAKLTGVTGTNGLILQYTSATTPSGTYWGVNAYNPTGADVDLTGAKLYVTQFINVASGDIQL